MQKEHIKNFKSVKLMKNSYIRNYYIKKYINFEMPTELYPQKHLFQRTLNKKFRMSSMTLQDLIFKDKKLHYHQNMFLMQNHMHLDEYIAKEFWFYDYQRNKPEFSPVYKKDSFEFKRIFKESTTKIASVYQLVLQIVINNNLSLDKIIGKLNQSDLKPTLVIHSYDRLYVFYRLNDNIVFEQAQDMLNKCKQYFKYKLHFKINEQFSLKDFVPLIFSISTFVPDTKEKVTYVNYPVLWNNNRYDATQLQSFLTKEIKQLKRKNISVSTKNEKLVKPYKNKYHIKFNIYDYLNIIYTRLEAITKKQYCSYNLDDLVTVAFTVIYLCSHNTSGQSILCPYIRQRMITKKFLEKVIPSMSGSKSMTILRYLIAIGIFNKENSTKTIQNKEYVNKRIKHHQLASFVTLATITDLLHTVIKAKQLYKYSKDNNLNISRLSLISYTMALGYKTISQNFEAKLIWYIFQSKGTSMTLEMYNHAMQYYIELSNKNFYAFMCYTYSKIIKDIHSNSNSNLDFGIGD